ncbi:phosphoribosylanthranilate isomerase [Brevibacillus daliensis]|uniref:phosphoribosylanthranilate isomerase n=1 Tax=Brevibacillus daliensis TaxID=2892995 RepID=UPI001E48D772|nr:phosphoribosylanthranilate isomerase [Brevibacillus daliensis]
MSQLKICGIRDSETMILLARLQVTYAGFVFAKSKRQVSTEEARQIVEQARVEGAKLPNASTITLPQLVGVFVNPTMEEVTEAVMRVPLHVIQLHGTETPTFCAKVRARFPQCEVWKAIGIGNEGDYKERIQSYKENADALLFDTHDEKQAGGTGRRFSWSEIPLLTKDTSPRVTVIAGGITPDNVTELRRDYDPAIIDLSSGVETEGKKDKEKIKMLVERMGQHVAGV